MYNDFSGKSRPFVKVEPPAHVSMCASMYVSATTKNSTMKISSALYEHSKRSFLQIQEWVGDESIQPADWGWVLKDCLLHPIKMK